MDLCIDSRQDLPAARRCPRFCGADRCFAQFKTLQTLSQTADGRSTKRTMNLNLRVVSIILKILSGDTGPRPRRQIQMFLSFRETRPDYRPRDNAIFRAAHETAHRTQGPDTLGNFRKSSLRCSDACSMRAHDYRGCQRARCRKHSDTAARGAKRPVPANLGRASSVTGMHATENDLNSVHASLWLPG